MIFRRKPRIALSRSQVTPDPQQAADLERRIAELSYQPQHGFLRDYRQERYERPAVLAFARFTNSEPTGSLIDQPTTQSFPRRN